MVRMRWAEKSSSEHSCSLLILSSYSFLVQTPRYGLPNLLLSCLPIFPHSTPGIASSLSHLPPLRRLLQRCTCLVFHPQNYWADGARWDVKLLKCISSWEASHKLSLYHHYDPTVSLSLQRNRAAHGLVERAWSVAQNKKQLCFQSCSNEIPKRSSPT